MGLVEDLSADNFDVPKAETKQEVSRLIRVLMIATRKHKLDYGSLRYIHRQVIKRAKLTIPRPGKKLYELPTSEELERFFDQIDDPQIKLLFLLLHHSGLRVSEACNLKVSKIDFQNQTLFITGKGDKDRLVPISSNLVEKLKLFLSGRNHIYLFESKLGTAYSTRRIEQLAQEIKTKAKITKKLTPHSMRHYYCTKLAEMGVNEDVRAMLAGHANSKTQEIYSHVGLAGTKDYILDILEKMESKKILK